MLASWMYVSRATFPASDANAVIEPIARVSMRRNADLEVTGALIFAVQHFAQYIEGPPAAVDFLRTAIERDDRHRSLHTVLDDRPECRRFGGWRIAYRGLATYVEKTIVSVQGQPTAETGDAAARLLRLFREFSLPDAR